MIAPATPSDPPRILLVEDDEDIARLILLHLRDIDARARHCARGDDALNLAAQDCWDLIVLDLRLPGLSGLDVCRKLREFDLLLRFAREPGRVFRRSELLDEVWGYGHDGYEHTVNTHINRLRRKIEADPSEPKHVVTVWGVGYRFQENP